MATPGTEATIAAAVATEAATQQGILDALVELLRWLWRRHLEDPFDKGQEARWADAAGRAVDAARRQASGVTEAYLRHVLGALLEEPFRGRSPRAERDPRGIPAAEQWARPVAEFRRAILDGLDRAVAEERALRRAEVMADIDLGMARRDAAGTVLAPADKVTGWRRIIHPERSKDGKGTCGLCIAAADRVYRKIEKMALHPGCHCSILPVTAEKDPGLKLSQDALKALYEMAGGTAREKLREVRFAVQEHGEIGAVLVDERHAFRGPRDVGRDAPDLARRARVELASLKKSLADLERRAAAGEDVAAPLAWQRERIAALEQLAAA